MSRVFQPASGMGKPTGRFEVEDLAKHILKGGSEGNCFFCLAGRSCRGLFHKASASMEGSHLYFRQVAEQAANVELKLSSIPVNYLCVPFAEDFEQPLNVVQCVNGVSLIRRFDGIFKPTGEAWICKDFVERHTQAASSRISNG
jgi:hypothetical protein